MLTCLHAMLWLQKLIKYIKQQCLLFYPENVVNKPQNRNKTTWLCLVHHTLGMQQYQSAAYCIQAGAGVASSNSNGNYISTYSLLMSSLYLSITDTLGPGHFLLQYRDFSPSEVKNVLVTPVGTQNFCPYCENFLSIVFLIRRVC